MTRITIIGTGYVGLVTGACLAEMGSTVTCLDIDHNKIDCLKRGNVPFFEPGLEELVKRGIASGRLLFSDQYKKAIRGAQYCFLALPTPSNADESCNISYVLKAATQLAEVMEDYLIVINKSTVPIGTAEKVRAIIAETLSKRGVDIPFDVASNPEFLSEGTAVKNYMHPDRILIGVDSPRAEQMMKQLYATQLDRLQVMDIPSTELSKYAANGMLALRISYMNELAGLCEKLGADIELVKQAIGADPRIGHRYLNPGIGFGGSCLPKDVKALRSTAKECDHSSALFDAILQINERQRQVFLEKIVDYFGNLRGKTLALWGLSFKPDTDDLREAPALYLIESLIELGANVKAFDPAAMQNAKALFPTIQFCADAYEAAEHSDAILLITEWEHFKRIDFSKIKCHTLFDGRNQYDPVEMENLGFDYFSIGKKQPIYERAH
ncbi:MAG: UDP-glucose/GDP-mannose dehydrogenase family protein [Verrucomicrobia bacterium]|nr:UDP-glucose/GDP-mannose dehydrogenase family protein [Verrucomicrobiota bacterium]